MIKFHLYKLDTLMKTLPISRVENRFHFHATLLQKIGLLCLQRELIKEKLVLYTIRRKVFL